MTKKKKRKKKGKKKKAKVLVSIKVHQVYMCQSHEKHFADYTYHSCSLTTTQSLNLTQRELTKKTQLTTLVTLNGNKISVAQYFNWLGTLQANHSTVFQPARDFTSQS